MRVENSSGYTKLGIFEHLNGRALQVLHVGGLQA